jgi:DNA-binding MarR family transcriptional regulator
MSRDQSRALPPSIIARIGFLHICIRKECYALFKEQDFPLEMDQIPVLMVLYYQEEALSQQEICSTLQRDKASVNRTISFFTQRDFVRVRPDETDKRKTRVELTPVGKKLGKRASEVLEVFERHLASAFTDAEKNEFDRLVSKLTHSIATPGTMSAIALI